MHSTASLSGSTLCINAVHHHSRCPLHTFDRLHAQQCCPNTPIVARRSSRALSLQADRAMHSLRLELSAATSASARLEAELKAKAAEAERSSNDAQARAFGRVCACMGAGCTVHLRSCGPQRAATARLICAAASIGNGCAHTSPRCGGSVSVRAVVGNPPASSEHGGRTSACCSCHGAMRFNAIWCCLRCDAMPAIRCRVRCRVAMQEGKAAAASLQEEMEARAACVHAPFRH